ALPLRLHYLLTAVSTPQTGPELAQEIIGNVVQSLHAHPILPRPEPDPGPGQAAPPQSGFLDALTLDELTQVWRALQWPYQLSVSCQIRGLVLDRA
ncbi:MAG TPA: Pvc16 family protein, partial [Chloroflexia bacterium]|nr:Pvc16 family protein [Chloroflexia bacterium]